MMATPTRRQLLKDHKLLWDKHLADQKRIAELEGLLERWLTWSDEWRVPIKPLPYDDTEKALRGEKDWLKDITGSMPELGEAQSDEHL